MGEAEGTGSGKTRKQASQLQDTASGLNRRVVEILGSRPWSWRRVGNPEFRKVMESLPEATAEISRLLRNRSESDAPLDDPTATRLEELLSTDPRNLQLDGAWQLLEGLQQMLLTLGGSDPAYVRTLLDIEAALESREGDWEEPWPYYGWGRVRWRDAFSPDELSSLRAALQDGTSVPDREIARAIEHLNVIFRMRIENGRKRRTRLDLRNHFLFYSFLLLTLLVAGLLTLTVWGSDGDVPWSLALLVAAAGAVGGTVSGVFKLRGLIRISEFMLLGMGLAVQPLLGAAAALFVLFVLASGVVEVPGVDSSDLSWAGLASYAFIAGFSEPFWLGVVRRMAGESGRATSEKS
jgi:hypothetical protein